MLICRALLQPLRLQVCFRAHFQNMDKPWLCHQVQTLSDLRNFELISVLDNLKIIKIRIIAFLKRPQFLLLEGESNGTKVVENYCWAITPQTARRSCWGRSCFRVPGFEFQLYSLLYKYTVEHIYTQFNLGKIRLAPGLRSVTIGECL